MYDRVIDWYKSRSKFWKIFLFVFVGLIVVGMFVLNVFSKKGKVIPPIDFIKQSKAKTDRQVSKYEIISLEEQRKRADLDKQINVILEEKQRIIDENRGIIEMLDRNCSDDDLKYIESELRRRDKR